MLFAPCEIHLNIPLTSQSQLPTLASAIFSVGYGSLNVAILSKDFCMPCKDLSKALFWLDDN